MLHTFQTPMWGKKREVEEKIRVPMNTMEAKFINVLALTCFTSFKGPILMVLPMKFKPTIKKIQSTQN